MADLDFKAKTLSGQWVFYENLKENNQIELYNAAKNGLNRVSEGLRNDSVPARLYSMSKEEAKKEEALLRKVFGVSIDFNPEDRDFYKELIRALNYSLGIKKVYQRNIERIKKGETQISIAQLFPSYFTTVWNNNAQRLMDKIVLKKRETIIQVADKVLTEELPNLVYLAIEQMLNSKDFNKDDSSQRAYQELLNVLQTQGKDSQIVKDLYNLYHLEELKRSILEQMTKSSSKTKRSKIKRADVLKIIGKNKYSDGGLSLEYLENYILNSLTQIKVKNKNFKVEAIHTGKHEIKADNIIAFNIDPTIIQQTLESSERVSRERNLALLDNLNKKMSHLNNSFIIYSNAKNYSLSKNFHGFSSGSEISLETLKNVLAPVQTNINTFIGAITNLIPGAIGDDRKKEMENAVASDIAYLLFDDVETIGVPQSGATALHLFDLNGIYIPLSYLLWELANSIKYGLDNPHLFVKVNITTPNNIQFEEGPWGYERWKEQRTTALQEIKISATFLQNFRDIINSL